MLGVGAQVLPFVRFLEPGFRPKGSIKCRKSNCSAHDTMTADRPRATYLFLEFATVIVHKLPYVQSQREGEKGGPVFSNTAGFDVDA